MSETEHSPEPPARPAPERTAEAPCIESQTLLGEGKLLWIAHAGERYCLRLTRRNRLILTK